jgi:hypothetical protein
MLSHKKWGSDSNKNGGQIPIIQNGGQIPIILALKSRLRRPPWGLIFLVFRSKNGPHAVQL